MANKNLFSNASRFVPQVDTHNKAGGVAYARTDAEALAQYACTGMFGNTFYTKAESQLNEVLGLATKVPVEFLAKIAVYSRKHGFMKDMPAVLLAVLAGRSTSTFRQVFPLVVDNMKMCRNFVQIMRSGTIPGNNGKLRTSLGTAPKDEVKKYLANCDVNYLFKQSVGNDPSLADIIKLVHPRANDKSRDALYAYLIGRPYEGRNLPKLVKDYERFKKSKPGNRAVPDVSFQQLTSLELTDPEWTEIARNAPWMMTRMNLNTFNRHGVFKDPAMVKLVASRLADKSLVQRAKAFPYQLLQAYYHTKEVPSQVRNALQDAMEIAVDNVPEIQGKIYIGVDCSASMTQDIAGQHGWAARGTSDFVTCNAVAALIASAFIRKNEDTEVVLYDTRVFSVDLNPRDSVMTNTQKLTANGGGTDCAAPIRYWNSQKAKGDLVIIVSDNESWAGATRRYGFYKEGTGVAEEFAKFKSRNKGAKLVCVDLTPGASSQGHSGRDVLNVGGFSDQVFRVIGAFAENTSREGGSFWTGVIEKSVGLG